MVDEALGEAFGGILVSGFYVAYHHYPGLKQRRRAHLLRDIHTLKVLYPENADLVRCAWRVQRLCAKARGLGGGRGYSSRGQLALEKRLLKLRRPFLEDPSAVRGKLCRRIERHIKSLPRTRYGELFVFVSHPEIPPDNNAEERSLRHLVLSRKISGGTRSGAGTGQGSQSPPGMPQTAGFPSTLNCYSEFPMDVVQRVLNAGWTDDILILGRGPRHAWRYRGVGWTPVDLAA